MWLQIPDTKRKKLPLDSNKSLWWVFGRCWILVEQHFICGNKRSASGRLPLWQEDSKVGETWAGSTVPCWQFLVLAKCSFWENRGDLASYVVSNTLKGKTLIGLSEKKKINKYDDRKADSSEQVRWCLSMITCFLYWSSQVDLPFHPSLCVFLYSFSHSLLLPFLPSFSLFFFSLSCLLVIWSEQPSKTPHSWEPSHFLFKRDKRCFNCLFQDQFCSQNIKSEGIKKT